MDNFNMSDIGMSISDLNGLEATLRNPETHNLPVGDKTAVWNSDGSPVRKDTTPQKMAAYEAKVRKNSVHRTFYWVMVSMAIIVLLLSVMLKNADAGQALMWFEVHTVTDKTIIVVDEYDTFFTFHKNDKTPVMTVGQEVMVVTDLKFVNGKWEMNRNRTAIMDTVKED